MYQLSQRYGLGALLIAAIIACMLWIGYVAGWGERAPLAGLRPAVQEVTLEEIRLAPDYPLPGPGPDLAETTARPLFNASRRPMPGVATAGSAGAGALPRGRYTLTGVSIAPDKRVALLRDAATSKTVRIEQGKELGGILVESVAAGKVTLKLGAEREDIALTIAPAPKVAAAAAPIPDRPAIPGQAAARSLPVMAVPLPLVAPPAAAAVQVSAPPDPAPRAAAADAPAEQIGRAHV